MFEAKFIHFIGLLDPEMVSLALIARQRGIKVSGSDERYRPMARQVAEAAGIMVYDGFSSDNVDKQVDLVILSRYYDVGCPEAGKAQKLGATVITQQAALLSILEHKELVGVVGSYGKSTVASLIKQVLVGGKQPLTYGIGGYELHDSGPVIARWSDDPLALWALSNFKADAATYTPAFMSAPAHTVVIPSVAFDYPELYNSVDEVYQAYYSFVRHIPRNGLIIGNSDNVWMKRLRGHLADRKIETYGIGWDASWRIVVDEQEDGRTTFRLKHQMGTLGPFTVPTDADAMIYAAAAAALVGHNFDVKLATMQQALAEPAPIYRHFEVANGKEKRILVDDRADHPDAIIATLKLARARYPETTLWCAYRPGSYLRTKAMEEELMSALSLADEVLILDIAGYPKEKSEGLHSRRIVAEMRQRFRATTYVESIAAAAELLSERAHVGDVILTLGDETVRQVYDRLRG